MKYVDGQPFQLTQKWTALKPQSDDFIAKSARLTLKEKKQKLKALKTMQREFSKQIKSVVKQSEGPIVSDHQYQSILDAAGNARQHK